jgi:hypothetical protein
MSWQLDRPRLVIPIDKQTEFICLSVLKLEVVPPLPRVVPSPRVFHVSLGYFRDLYLPSEDDDS